MGGLGGRYIVKNNWRLLQYLSDLSGINLWFTDRPAPSKLDTVLVVFNSSFKSSLRSFTIQEFSLGSFVLSICIDILFQTHILFNCYVYTTVSRIICAAGDSQFACSKFFQIMIKTLCLSFSLWYLFNVDTVASIYLPHHQEKLSSSSLCLKRVFILCRHHHCRHFPNDFCLHSLVSF